MQGDGRKSWKDNPESLYLFSVQRTTNGGDKLWNKPNYISNLRHITDEHFAEFIL
jgi:hypothetical protein